MKNLETGEFELVLGNRQLLSGFFVVVILFAVFFVMGYIVGRNSTPATQLAASRDQTSRQAASNTRPQPASGQAPAPQTSPAQAAESPAESATQEAAGNPSGEPQPTTRAAEMPPAKTEPPAPAVPAPGEPVPGETYLQAYSGKMDVAETVAKTLKEKGFPSLLSAGPQGKTRVLVGPYADLAKLGQAKADLERLGFSPFRQKIEK
ncbi:MAG TPA: SPOR domain-containing protein [Bryobacteraceae bacterium]|nr:SPOR domain-containing protein [Bryobacteraceae bacterium]